MISEMTFSTNLDSIGLNHDSIDISYWTHYSILEHENIGIITCSILQITKITISINVTDISGLIIDIKEYIYVIFLATLSKKLKR